MVNLLSAVSKGAGHSITAPLFISVIDIPPYVMPSERGSRWSVTINLKTVNRDTAEECIARARQNGWNVFGQLETGESGTDHYQLAVSTPQIRFSAMKKMFPTAHIEIAKDWHALLAYCNKEETRVETLKNVSTGYIGWSQLRNMFIEWLNGQMFERLENDHEKRLEIWDRFIGFKIREGYEVDLMGVNPQYRACVSRYWTSYILRQSDRQTEQEVVVPTIHKQDGVEEEESDGSSSESGSEGSWPSDASPF